MKISEVVAALLAIQEEHGDLYVESVTGMGSEDVNSVEVFHHEEDEKPVALLDW